MFEQLAQDPDRETLGRLLAAWQSVHGNRPAMIREAVTAAETSCADDAKTLRESLWEVAEERGNINRRRLGRWIARHQGRIVDGKRFVRAPGATSAERWIVEQTSTDLSVKSVLAVSSDGLSQSVQVDETLDETLWGIYATRAKV